MARGREQQLDDIDLEHHSVSLYLRRAVGHDDKSIDAALSEQRDKAGVQAFFLLAIVVTRIAKAPIYEPLE